MAIELIVDTPVLKGEKGDKGDTGSFDYTHLEEIVDEHLDNRFSDVEASLDLKVDKEVGKSLVDDDYIAKLDNLETLDKTVVEKFNDKVEQSDLEENLIQIEGQLQKYIDEQLVTAGSGDMLKSVYDTDGDGVVDIAENANNADKVNNLTVETAVPPDAVFTDTTYETVTTETNGLMSSVDKIKLNGIENGANNTEIINNLTSEETTKALSANQGKGINDRLKQVENMTPVLLFQGAVSNGTFSLSESAFNYRNLAIGISSLSGGNPFAWALIPVLPNSAVPTYQSFAGFNCAVADNGKNSISSYCGRLSKNEEGTEFTFVQQITNVSHTSGETHGGGSTYNIAYIYGIK
ncbi:hypothetical protein ACTQYZ_08800 [Anaerofustis sp. LCP19S3_F7]|uniref:hypothetical protein n=1 Tax=Anaerofustis sp. LCP19S3_F7 TaxID=3440247 RepID=UPI003F8F49D2